MELKAGYKQTEVGVIPDDWEVRTIQQIAPLQRGFDLPTRQIKHGPVPVVYSNGITNYHNKAMVSGPGVVTGRSGTLGNVHYIQSDYWPHNTALWVTNFHGNSPKFVFYLYTLVRFERFASGSGVPTLNRNDAHSYRLAFPPNLREQEAIAEALCDMDAFIESLDKLIAKKRDLKQATTQELLTGKTRLPGFSGAWEFLNMARHSTLKARIGWEGLTTAEYLESGQYALVTGTDFIDGKIDWNNCHFVEKARYDQDKNIQLQPNDILLTKDGTIGKAAFVESLNFPATLNSGVFVIRPKGGRYKPSYFYYVLMSRIFTDFLNKLQAGSTISHLYQKDFVNFEFLAPATETEQTAIAAAISDMDAEIEALEKRRAKTLDLKQGMMKELLTGKTRLVKQEVTHA